MIVTVVGAGSFGTALAICSVENGHETRLWMRSQKQLENIKNTGTNGKYLPGISLSADIGLYTNLEEALNEAELVIFAVPTQTFRTVLGNSMKYVSKDAIIVNVAKGIEEGTLKLPSQIAKDYIEDRPFVCLSGPSHAELIAEKYPTTLVASSDHMESAEKIQDLLISDSLRIYTNSDVIGVELGGALKNIIALCAGISDGLNNMDNAKAALMTRGMAEITRLGVAMGAKPETFFGLTGMGDLIVTCTSLHSRNRMCGIYIGSGMAIEDAIAKVEMVVEGVYTARATKELAAKLGVEMPITEAINKVLEGKLPVSKANEILMNRDRKHE